jgi:DNA-binding transcriptional ArsR family regulator
MSSAEPGISACAPEHLAPVFAALGDRTRLGLLSQLSAAEARNISQLAEGSHLTRQGLTRHLQVLEDAGIVTSSHTGRERYFRLEPAPLREMRDYLERVARHWDDTLERLRNWVED